MLTIIITTVTKIISFKTNYEQDLRIGFELRKKGKSIRVL